MKPTKNSSRRAAALQIRLRITLILLWVALLALAVAPARTQIEQKWAPAGIAAQSTHRRAGVSESSASSEGRTSRKSASIEISASHQRVSGREIAGFSARQERTGQEGRLTPPAGLKPIEEEAWLAMARRQEASGVMGLESFYPARYGEPFIVESEGVRVAVRPVGGTDAAARIDNGQVIYRQAYPETDSVHAVSSGRSVAACYTFSPGSGPYVRGDGFIDNQCDNCSTIIPLPFPVSIYGQTYTSAAAGSNGHLTFGTVYDDFFIGCWPSDQGTVVLAPYWTNQSTTRGGFPRAGILTAVRGTHPNRVFYIEYRTQYSGVPPILPMFL